MTDRLWDRALLWTAIAVTLVTAILIAYEWRVSADSISRFTWVAFAPALVAALVSYLLRSLRFYYFLARSGISISLRSALFAQAVGFAFAITPGRIGEVFKLRLVREQTGTPVAQTAPLLLLDRLTEGGGFMILTIVSALMLPAGEAQAPRPWLIVLGLGAIVVFALTRRHWGRPVGLAKSLLVQSRFGNYLAPHFSNLWLGAQTGFTPSHILGGLALTTVARFADGLVVFVAADMLGVPITLPEAVFVLGASGLIGGASLLPAGVGAVETAMTGMLALTGASLSKALAITLLSRLSTLWVWVALGLVLAFWLRLFAPSSFKMETNGSLPAEPMEPEA